MKGKKVVLALMVVALLVLPTAMSASAAEPGDPDTTVTVTSTTLECGSAATSQILITTVNGETDPKEVRGVEVHLAFDPALLQVVDADGDPGNGVQLTVESELFDGDLHMGQNLVDNEAGTIVFAVAQSDGTPVFNVTNKAIATITWECTGECPEGDVMTEVTVMGNTLMSDPDGYPILVDSAVNGTITFPACVTTGCIEGYINPQGRYDFSGVHVMAVLYAVGSADVAPNPPTLPTRFETYTDASGYFKLEGMVLGTYDVTAEMYGYLDAMASVVDVIPGEECTVLSATTLWGGDVAPQPEPDNLIDILDVSYIGANFGIVEATADVNLDGVVNILDLTVAAANFGMSGPLPWAETAEPIVFEAGGTNAAVEGQVAANGVNEYMLSAEEGELMEVSIDSPNNDVFLSIYGLSDGIPLVRAAAEQTAWRGLLPASQRYSIKAVSSGSSSSYILFVRIPAWIEFASGSNSAVIQGDINANQLMDYVLYAQEGQTMSVTITSPNNDVFLSIVAIEDGIPLVRIAADATQWSGVLPGTEHYRISAFASGQSTAYTLEVTLE